MNTEPVQGVAAGVAITSPYWLPAVHTASEVAALLLPILGVVWLGTQIVSKIIEARRTLFHIKVDRKL